MSVLSDAELLRLLDDDVPCGDLTTAALGLDGAPGRPGPAGCVEFRARRAMRGCAGEEAERLLRLAGCDARLLLPSGSAVEEGGLLLEARGSAATLHRVWKTAQTLMEWASGIATAAAALVEAAQQGGRRVAVACTRKNVPGTKALSIKAVRAGGATVHRLGLSETLLVFPEHRLFLDEAPSAMLARLRQAEPEKKIVVEVGSPDEALRWAEAGADVLQLEKFSPPQVAACRERLDALASRPLLAPAGGIRADNAAAYVAAGADFLITSAPYTAPPCDVQVNFLRGP